MNLNDKMQVALELAKRACELDEVPIGAVVFRGDEVICKTHNECEAKGTFVKHAELIAIELACEIVGSKYLNDCEIFVTMEPCPMCMGAIMLSRFKNVYFGCYDYKFGACGSKFNLLDEVHYKSTQVYGGIMELECSDILKEFFKSKR